MKKRLLALFLVFVMVVGLLPTSVFAADESEDGPSTTDASTSAGAASSYTITFIKDAFNMTSVEVYLRDGIGGDFSPYISNLITLDGASFSIGDGDLPISNLLTGYGLLELSLNNAGTGFQPEYYFQYATWGESTDSNSVVHSPLLTSITYEDVVAHADEGLYFYYKMPANTPFTVTAVDENNTQIATGEIASGTITTEVAQRLLANQNVSTPYYFDHAELRPADGNNQTAIPVDNIKLINGYYYVTSSISPNDQDTFSSQDWNVYFVYENAYQLTLNVRYESGASAGGTNEASQNYGNTIDGEGKVQGTYTYQFPQHGILEVPITIATTSNLKVTDTTPATDEVLFDSAVDGYELKEYTLVLNGELLGGNKTVDVVFTPSMDSNGGYTLDYTHYVENPSQNQAYHGFSVALNGTDLSRSNTTTTIRQGNTLTFNAGSGSDADYMLNTLVFNSNALALPSGWVWTDGWDNTYTLRDLPIEDSAGATVAVVDIETFVDYDWYSGDIYRATTTVTFKSIIGDIRLDRANLAPYDYPDLIIYEMGEGLNVQFLNQISEPNRRDAPVGCGIYPDQNGSVFVTPEFGYYVSRFRMGENDEMLPPTGTPWYGEKDYYTDDSTDPNAPSKINREKIRAARSSPGYIESALINFTFRYDWDGAVGGGYYTDGVPFTLDLDTLETPELDATLRPTVPTGMVFVGWSLTPTNGGDAQNYYVPGQAISRAVLEETPDAITYGDTGEAIINLYPVFQDEGSSPYVGYTVTVHADGSTATYALSGGLYGASLDRDSVLALPDVKGYVDTLTNVVMDGAQSDSLVKLERGGNEFHLYFNSTLPVTVTFVSEHGFTDDRATTEKATSQNPATVMTVPTPYEGYGVNASFVGWSLNANSTTGIDLTNSLVPYENTTYYAIYAPNKVVNFYRWTEADGWSLDADHTISVESGQTIPADQQTAIENLTPTIDGYDFKGWARNGPSGATVQLNALMGTPFTSDTDYYAVYTPKAGISVTLNANGGTFKTGATMTLSNQAYGQTINYEIPTRQAGYVFAGWSTDANATVGQMAITVPAASGTTYHAVWVLPQLEVSVTSPDFVYDGTQKTPTINVTYNGKAVAESEYTVDYGGGNRTDAGIYTVLVTYQDLQGLATFIISPKPINDQSITVDSIPEQEYIGSELRPNVTVKDGNKTLLLNTDYVVSYSNNINVGGGGSAPTVTIKGIGNYGSTRTAAFQIVSPHSVTIAPISDQEFTGSAITPNLMVYDSNGRLMTKDTDYTVSFTNNTAVGQATAHIDGIGNYAGKSTSTTFRIVAAGNALTVNVNPAQMTTAQGAPTITVTSGGVTLNASNDYTLSYQMYGDGGALEATSSDMSKTGVYLITATGKGNYLGATGSATFVRVAVSTGSDLVITGIDVADQVLTYNGTNQNAVLDNLDVEYKGAPLEGPYNLSISYNNGEEVWNSTDDADLTDAGIYLVQVKTNEDYHGNATLTIYIQPKNIADASVEVEGTLTAVYNGQAHEHPFTVTDTVINNGDLLVSGTDYTLVDPNHNQHTDVGSFPLTIHGTGNYTGTRLETFTITPKVIDVTGSIALDYGYTTDEATAALASIQAAAQTQIISGDIASISLYVDDNLPVGENQHHIHGLITGTDAGNYSLNIDASVTVNRMGIDDPNMLAVTIYPLSAPFTGAPHYPAIVVTHNNVMLVENEDYTLSYQSGGTDVGADGMVDVGAYTIAITGIGNYDGVRTVDYTITPVNSTGRTGGLTIAPISSQIYTGSPITPELTVSFDGKALVKDADYTVSYDFNVNVGHGVVTVTGKDGTNYEGMSGTATFIISPKDIAGSTMDDIPDVTYTGSPIQPVITVTDGGRRLTEGTDYYVEYTNNLNAGDNATVTIFGINNYMGTKVATFHITAARIDGGDPSTPNKGFTVAVYPPTGVYTGAAHDPAVVVTYNGITLDANSDYTLTYETLSGSTVGAGGMVDVGTYVITVTGRGNYTGAVEARYTITPVNDSNNGTGGSILAIDPITTQIYTGSPITPAVTVTYNGEPVQPGDYTVSYSANTNVGQATIIVTGNANTNYEGMVGTATFTIKPKSITGSDITVASIADQTYTSSPITPEVDITDGTRSANLINGADYILGYKHNVDVSTKTATVVITGRGNYTGTREVTFNINKADIGGGDGDPTTPGQGFTVAVYPDSGGYTGAPHTPAVVVHFNNQLLAEGKDYDLSYQKADGTDVTGSGMIDVGDYTITITGKGNYQGTVTVVYEITPVTEDNVLVIKPIEDAEYTGSAIQPAIEVTYAGKTLTENTDYTVSYSTTLINAGVVVVTVTGLGDTYGSLSAVAAFQITRKDIAGGNITVDPIVNQSYTGGYIVPTVTVTDGDRDVVLTQNADFTVEYADNLNAGTSTVTIRGIGNYTGTRTITFQIDKADVSDPDGTGGIIVNVYPASGVFNGSAHSPAVIVTHSGTILVPEIDYHLTYSGNMTDVGVYTITVTGRGNYSGTTTATYTITTAYALAISDINDVVYNGTAQTPEITVTHRDETLIAGTDYDVAYANNTNAGLATVTVTGKGSYENMTGITTFAILPKTIDESMVAAIEDQVYTGSAIQPIVTVTDADTTLVLNQDYTVAYGVNVASTGSVTVSGIRNYTGTVKAEFTIAPKSISTITGVQDSYTYTGSPTTPELTVMDNAGRQLIKDTDYTITYTDNLNVGTATVTVTGLGVYSGQTKEVTFQITAKLLYLDVTVTPDTAVYGDGTTPAISVSLDGSPLTETTDYTLSYQMYEADGTLTAAAPLDDAAAQLAGVGMYVITATGTGEYEGAMGSSTFIRLPDGGDLVPSGGGLTDGSNVITLTYNGQNQRSVLDGITISTAEGAPATVTSTTVSYNSSTAVALDENYQMVNAGIYTVTYTAEEGTAYVVVVINPKDISDPTITVAGLGESDYTYDGTVQTPVVSLTDSENPAIAENTDYTVSVDPQTDAGTYTVTFAGDGNYTGYRYENFIINQKGVTVEESREIAYDYGYTGPISLVQDTDYMVSGIAAGDEAGVTVSVTVPAGLSTGSYPISAQLSGDRARNYTLTGDVAITVNPIDMDGDGVVDPDKDDDNDGNTEDSNGDGVIETVNGFTISMVPTSGAFTGLAHNPVITVTYKPGENEPITLIRDVDYTVTYLDSEGTETQMIQVGSYTVRVQGAGNYSGTFDLTYTITQGTGSEGGDGDIDNDGNYEDGDGDHIINVGGFQASLTPYSGYSNGQPHNPRVTVTFTSGQSTTTLIENVHFTVAYYNSTGTTAVPEMIEVGTYTVRVTGIGNYAGNNFDLVYTILSTPDGGGGGTTPTDPDDSEDTPNVMDPDETGVSKWLNTTEHMAYLQGYPGDLFGPNDNMTRAEAAQMFYNLLLNKDVPITVSFDDVAEDAWYADAVNTLASIGIINGIGNNLYDPMRSISRAEFTTIAMRFGDLEVGGENIFPDVSPDDWFYEYVVGSIQYGWIQGYPNGNFGPHDTITRAEVTTIVNRMLGRSPDKSYADSHLENLVQFDDVFNNHWAYYQIVEATNAHDYTKSDSQETWTGLH